MGKKSYADFNCNEALDLFYSDAELLKLAKSHEKY